MATIDIDKTRLALQNFDFKGLFIEELGWSNPTNTKSTSEVIKEIELARKPIAELSGALVFEITTKDGQIPESKERTAIAKEIQKLHHEHVLIFIDDNRNQSVWHWLKNQDKKIVSREHIYIKGQPGDLFISKISSLVFDISEFDAEGNVPIAEVASRIKSALDIERVTKKFFKDYEIQHIEFIDLIQGIDNEKDKKWYASVILNRLMFIYFLQKKLFLNNGEADYLVKRLEYSQKELGKNKFYEVFLQSLFFEGFAKTEKDRSKVTNDLIGKIKYLNGGLFLKHKIEIKYASKIKISDKAFENLFGLFDSYSWTLDDTPGGKDNEINPDVLGYIFEKYINQKAFGAYYTRTEITEYLCEQTVYKLILDAVNEPEIDPEILKKSGLDKHPKGRHFNSIEELMLKLDAGICKKLLVGGHAVLPNMSLLDPACGSGAFLVAAMKTLINVYAAVLGKIDFLGDKKLTDWKNEIQKDHPSINYYIKKQIITNNLYGVDIMEEATEIAKLRLFLALVSSANTVDQLEPLPNIDFNIMCGNSLIGMMRVDENQFNKRVDSGGSTLKGKVVKENSLFEAGLVQGNIFAQEHAKSYQQLINEKEAAILAYKNASGLGSGALAEMRDSIQENEKKAYKILNQLLVEEFTNLGIKYHQVNWDEKKEKEGILQKRAVTLKDIKDLTPFHWGYDFSNIFRNKNGFDAIITNPPWEIFKPQDKEFFITYSSNVKKNTQSIKDFQKEKKDLLANLEIRNSYLTYMSSYPHVSQYYRQAPRFENQTSVVDGKKAGSDINLYKLFTEQCHNLLRKKGYCGIVIPSGIYTDLGTKQLRKLLLESSDLTNLISMSNERNLFEGVMHNFKFCLLTFKKDNPKDHFNAAFKIYVHEAISPDQLDGFLGDKKLKVPLEVVKNFAPISLSILEYKDQLDLDISKKLIRYPMLSEFIESEWNMKFSSEFHMTNNSSLFKEIRDKDDIVLYEGKMINQFTHVFGNPRYFIDHSLGRSAILGRNEEDKGQELSYQKYRIGTRSIGGSANERGLIATIIPPNVFCGNSLLLSNEKDVEYALTNSQKLLIVALLNSYPVDYCIRQMVATNINMFYLKQLHIPRLNEKSRWFNYIVERTAKLICTSQEYAELYEEVFGDKWSESKIVKSEENRNKIRAEIDGLVPFIYGFDKSEFEYILSTFPVVSDIQKKNVIDEFVKIREKENSFSIETKVWSDLILIGESPKVEFKSTLRIDLQGTGKPEKFIEFIILKTIAALLNSEGGTLFIGVKDDKSILGLESDFDSFSKPDKLDEFQKHLDNLIGKTIGNHTHHYLDIEFPVIDGKIICTVTVKEKSSEPIFIKNDKGQDAFYIRRLASTIELSGAEVVKYCKDHWK